MPSLQRAAKRKPLGGLAQKVGIMAKGYGKSAFIKGCEIYSTDGNDVDIAAMVSKGETVEDRVRCHQRQPEIIKENRSVIFLWFIILPAIVIAIFRVILWVAEWFI
jgi:hypothetical protein